LEEYGEAEGQQRFRRFVDPIAATSNRNPIGSNVRTASYYYGLMSGGEPLPEKLQAPYGGLA
jgi:hypothetical protein